MKQISENVYVETAQPGCNFGFVVTNEGIVMIDSPQQPSFVSTWKKTILDKGKIRFLINTEHHRDHIIGDFFFDAPIVMHAKSREALLTLSLKSIMERIETSDPEGLPLVKGFYVKKPTIVYHQEMSLHLGGHTIKLIHMPGHTAGMTTVYIPEERIVFTGDNISHRVQTFFHQSYPDQWLESLKRIAALDAEVIVPGHGDICGREYIEEQTAFIHEWIDAVKQAVRQGLSKKEAQEKISFVDRYPMDIGLSRERAIEVQRMNVDRLYDLFQLSSKPNRA
ncbi:MAG: MBL fold metallo-hydrolase [Thermodesulfobacteriota bacterium]